jgi:anti-anti-sigma factor
VFDGPESEALGLGGELRGRLERRGDRTVYAVTGELDGFNAGALAARLDELAGTCGGTLVLQLDDLELADAAGLRALLQKRQELAERGCRLVIRRPPVAAEPAANGQPEPGDPESYPEILGDHGALRGRVAAGGAGTVYRLWGELDASVATRLMVRLLELGGDEGTLTVDMAGVSLLDSAGLRALVDARELLAERGTRLVIRRAPVP